MHTRTCLPYHNSLFLLHSRVNLREEWEAEERGGEMRRRVGEGKEWGWEVRRGKNGNGKWGGGRMDWDGIGYMGSVGCRKRRERVCVSIKGWMDGGRKAMGARLA